MIGFTSENKVLTVEELELLERQNSRLVAEHKAERLELDAKKHWDLFYKRNETRFFKDRHWTTREFQELLDDTCGGTPRVLFEIGCGVGNFIFPLIDEGLNFRVIACDLSPRAVEIVKKNELYNEEVLRAFEADITGRTVHSHVASGTVDIATLIFVLSAVHPEKFEAALGNVYEVLKPGGILLFRDYGLYDMAQLRFKAGCKIAENFYMRQDGTRSYYFSTDFISELLGKVGFETISNCYVHRRTVNKKENIDVPRIFVQGKFRKPI